MLTAAATHAFPAPPKSRGEALAGLRSPSEAARAEAVNWIANRGAHEYLGEAYLMVGNVAKAKEHLSVLDKLCFFPCDEYSDLKKAIADYERKQVSR